MQVVESQIRNAKYKSKEADGITPLWRTNQNALRLTIFKQLHVYIICYFL